MSDEKNLENFFKSLKLVFNNASVYFQDHPVFIESLDNFKTDIENFLATKDVVKISVLPDSLSLDYLKLQNIKICQDIAMFLHHRKIKAIEFRRGITLEQLRLFFKNIILPVKDIAQRGGIETIFKDNNLDNPRVEELNYASLLNLEEDDSLHKPMQASLLDKETDLLPLSAANPTISNIYRNTLESLQSASSNSQDLIDRDSLKINYRWALLNLLALGQDFSQTQIIINNLNKVAREIFDDKDWDYFKKLFSILNDKREFFVDTDKRDDFNDIYNLLRLSIAKLIEEYILSGQVNVELGYLVNYIDRSFFSIQDYIIKIFDGRKITPFILELFFKLYPKNIDQFCQALKTKQGDIKFIGDMVDNLKFIDKPQVVKVLEVIYQFPNEYIKRSALAAMANFSNYDKDFLLNVIKKGNLALRAEALRILSKDAQDEKVAVKLLLLMFNPLGLRNRKLLENIRIVGQITGVRAKEEFNLLLKSNFWGSEKIRKAIMQVMNVGINNVGERIL